MARKPSSSKKPAAKKPAAKKPARKSSKPTVDNYEVITNTVVAAIEKVVSGESKRLPWRRDWRSLGKPRNGFSNRPYSGINLFLLGMMPYGDPRWGTSNQIMAQAGYERNSEGFGPRWIWKGEGEAPVERILNGESTPIILWRFIDVEEEREDGTKSKKRIPILRTFRVYNFEQVNWPAGHEPKPLTDDDAEAPEFDAEADALLDAYLEGAEIPVEYKGDRAFYSPKEDRIQLPLQESFRTGQGYLATKAHEIVHSTGHHCRQSRDLLNSFGTPAYAREELVAELGAAFLCADLGVESAEGLDENHIAYLQSWMEALKNNKYEIFTAARLAREAVACVKKIGKWPEEEKVEAEEAA